MPEVGRLVQYQSYNVDSALNHAAAHWTEQNLDLLPIDTRDILDRRRLVGRKQQATGEKPLVQLVAEDLPSGQLVEIVESDTE